MKKIITTLLCVSTILSATAADIYVNNSGQPGTYTSINAAVAAANSGDNVYISPFSVYTEDISIDKSISLISGVSDTYFNVIGTIDVTGFGAGKVKFIGLSVSGNINGTNGTSSLFNETEVYIIDCKVGGSVYFNSVYYIDVHVYYSTVGNQTRFTKGDIIGSNFNNTVYIQDGPNVGIGDTIRIIGNYFDNCPINWYNDDHYFLIANNCFQRRGTHLQIDKHHYNSLSNNNVINNTFHPGENYTAGIQNYSGDGTITISSSTVSQGNIYFINNLMARNYGNRVNINGTGQSSDDMRPKLIHNVYGNSGGLNGLVNVVGNVLAPDDLIVEPLEKCLNPAVVDKGLPSLEYYDIDMTINDVGIHGGPYSIDNYRSSGNGKARVYDLDMPFEIWNGQTPQVKANATHTK